jgi:hypothetical protein
MAAKRYPTYSVELVGYGNVSEPTLLTLYTDRLSSQAQDWWYTRSRSAIPSVQAVTTFLEVPASTQIVLNLGTSLAL